MQENPLANRRRILHRRRQSNGPEFGAEGDPIELLKVAVNPSESRALFWCVSPADFASHPAFVKMGGSRYRPGCSEVPSGGLRRRPESLHQEQILRKEVIQP